MEQATQLVTELGLSQHLDAHTSDARCVTTSEGLLASGGRDSVLKVWPRGGDVLVAQEAKWVNAVASIAPGQLNNFQHGGIVTGGQDGLIRIYSLEGNKLTPQHELQAHGAPVCSLFWFKRQGQALLLSGGWDGIAKVWDLEYAKDSSCPATALCGHENNVCVIGLANGDIITGSTGMRDEATDGLIGFQLRVWRKSTVVQAIGQENGGHTGAIRDLAAISAEGERSAFASASNDGTVGIWHIDTAETSETPAIATYSRVVTVAVPSGTFVFSVCYVAVPLSNSGGIFCGKIFTGDDAGELCVFDLCPHMFSGKDQSNVIRPVQRIRHPKTVWSVSTIEATGLVSDGICAVATACADGVVRTFSTNSESHLSAEAQHASLGPKTAAPSSATGDYTMSTSLPRASERGLYTGSELGAISLFLDDDNDMGLSNGMAAVLAFKWSKNHDTDGDGWIQVGRVLEPVKQEAQEAEQLKQELDGELFEQIIPVEIDSASQGQLSFLLGINAGDDPTSVATKFCQKHALMDEYIPQIAMFLESYV